MRVAYVIDSLAAGGAERSVLELVPAVAGRGVDVALVTRKAGGALVPAARAAGVRVVELGTARGVSTSRALTALLGEHRPDLVHTALFEAHVAGRPAAARLGLPLVSTLTGTPYGADHRAEPGLSSARVRLAHALDAATAQLVWRFHAPAAHVADVMAARLGVPRDRIAVIPRARDADALGERSAARRDRVRASLGVPDDAAVVVALARHQRVKGLDVLLDAVPAVAAATDRALVVLVAGRTGEATSELERRAEHLRGSVDVRLLGHRDDVADLLAAADVVAVPSRREGLPGTVVEATALGVPVVASDLPGCREVLGEALGVRVPPEDPGALAAALVAVLADPAAAGDLAAGRARARARFGVDAVAAATVALWVRTIADGPDGRTARAAGALAAHGGSVDVSPRWAPS